MSGDTCPLKDQQRGAAGGAPWVKRLTLDFSSGHGLIVHGMDRASGSVLIVQSLFGILSLPLCPSPAYAFSLSLSLPK